MATLSFSQDLDLKERVRSAVDIVDVLGRQMELRRQGANFVARCPWHDDRRPSLMINQARQTWRCWVCDVGGDVFSFVMKRDGVSFPEAMRTLAEIAGITIEVNPNAKPIVPGSKDDKATLMAAMRWAVDQYVQCFKTSSQAEAARKYALSRGIDDENLARFKIGYAPESWDWLLNRGQKEGFSGEILEASGLAVARKTGGGFYDMFRDRLMFPIFDLQGRPISLGGRVLPGGEGKGGKYINGPETKVFSKQRQLYGLNLARDAVVKQGRVMVMEGYTDVIAARQAGIETVVAVLGTALGQHHVKILKRFAETVVLVLDGDAAGQRRADEVLEIFVGADVDLRVLTLPDGQDPADYIKTFGADQFYKIVDEAPDAIDHKLQRLTDGVDLTHDTHRSSKAIEGILSVLSVSPNPVGDIRMQQMLMRLSRTFNMPQQHLERRLGELRQKRSQTFRRQDVVQDQAEVAKDGWDSNENETTAATTAFANDPIQGLDRLLFETLIESPELVAQAIEVIEPGWLSSQSARELLNVYQSLELQGLSFDVGDCMLLIENESLKNQVIKMDEQVSQKKQVVVLASDERLRTIIARYREVPHLAEVEQRLSLMDQGTIPEDEALDLLDELFAAQRLRHGWTGE